MTSSHLYAIILSPEANTAHISCELHCGIIKNYNNYGFINCFVKSDHKHRVKVEVFGILNSDKNKLLDSLTEATDNSMKKRDLHSGFRTCRHEEDSYNPDSQTRSASKRKNKSDVDYSGSNLKTNCQFGVEMFSLSSQATSTAYCIVTTLYDDNNVMVTQLISTPVVVNTKTKDTAKKDTPDVGFTSAVPALQHSFSSGTTLAEFMDEGCIISSISPVTHNKVDSGPPTTVHFRHQLDQEHRQVVSQQIAENGAAVLNSQVVYSLSRARSAGQQNPKVKAQKPSQERQEQQEQQGQHPQQHGKSSCDSLLGAMDRDIDTCTRQLVRRMQASSEVTQDNVLNLVAELTRSFHTRLMLALQEPQPQLQQQPPASELDYSLSDELTRLQDQLQQRMDGKHHQNSIVSEGDEHDRERTSGESDSNSHSDLDSSTYSVDHSVDGSHQLQHQEQQPESSMWEYLDEAQREQLLDDLDDFLLCDEDLLLLLDGSNGGDGADGGVCAVPLSEDVFERQEAAVMVGLAGGGCSGDGSALSLDMYDREQVDDSEYQQIEMDTGEENEPEEAHQHLQKKKRPVKLSCCEVCLLHSCKRDDEDEDDGGGFLGLPMCGLSADQPQRGARSSNNNNSNNNGNSNSNSTGGRCHMQLLPGSSFSIVDEVEAVSAELTQLSVGETTSAPPSHSTASPPSDHTEVLSVATPGTPADIAADSTSTFLPCVAKPLQFAAEHNLQQSAAMHSLVLSSTIPATPTAAASNGLSSIAAYQYPPRKSHMATCRRSRNFCHV